MASEKNDRPISPLSQVLLDYQAANENLVANIEPHSNDWKVRDMDDAGFSRAPTTSLLLTPDPNPRASSLPSLRVTFCRSPA